MTFSSKLYVNWKWPDYAGAGSVIDEKCTQSEREAGGDCTAFCIDLPTWYVIKEIYVAKVPLFNISNMGAF